MPLALNHNIRIKIMISRLIIKLLFIFMYIGCNYKGGNGENYLEFGLERDEYLFVW